MFSRAVAFATLPWLAALVMLLPTSSRGQAAEEIEPPGIEILSPQLDKTVRAIDGVIDLIFTIHDASPLQSVIIEVKGTHTGIFFTVCGDGESACTGEPPTFTFSQRVPVFEGHNVVKIIVRDAHGNTSETIRELTMTVPVTVAPPTVERHRPLSLPAVLEPLPLPERPLPMAAQQYSLLVLAHSVFKDELAALVQHKNASNMPTLFMELEAVYETPAYRGRDHAEIIKKAIADAQKKWGIKYVMLIGDADRFPVRYTRTYDLGHWGNSFAASDLYYADLYDSQGNFSSWDFDNDDLFGEMQGNFPKDANDLNQDRLDLVPDVAVGRIPASDEAEVSTYVNKVIYYEKTAKAGWFKGALLITGDYPGSNATNDVVASSLQSQSFDIKKLYHDTIWPTTPYPQRVALIETELNTGVGFVSYVGHGYGVDASQKHGGGWGGWYSYDRVASLNNAARLPVIFSAACETAMFHSGYGAYAAKLGFEYVGTPLPPGFDKYRSAPEPMAVLPDKYEKDALSEHFLVKSANGAIGFIGAYTGTQGDSHTLAKYFFEAYSSGANTLGDGWNAAIKKFVDTVVLKLGFPGHSWYTVARYHHIHKMLLFGDPSLRLGGVPGLARSQGKITYLRVHDVGTAFGPPGDVLDADVVFKLDTEPESAFGVTLRSDANRSTHGSMLAVLRDAFESGSVVHVDYERNPRRRNSAVIRVWSD